MNKPTLILIIMFASVGASLFARDSGDVPPAIDRLNCEAGETACDNLRQCISKDLFCNGFPDCDDGSDEKTPHCYYRFFRCEWKVIRSYLLCDGKVDCPDGSDEVGCLTKPPEEPSTTTPIGTEITTSATVSITNSITEGTTENEEASTEWVLTTEADLSSESTSRSDVVTAPNDETTTSETSAIPSTETTTMLTMTAKEEGTVNGENKLYVTSAREPDDVKSEEIQESLIAGFGWWITLIFAFFGGLAVMLAVVTQLYIWIWKKSNAAKQSSVHPNQCPEIKNEDIFSTHSFSSAGSTSRSIQSSDFYFISPSTIVVDTHH